MMSMKLYDIADMRGEGEGEGSLMGFVQSLELSARVRASPSVVYPDGKLQ